MKPLLVGENNPYSNEPKHALYPWPPNSAGWRLCHRILDLQIRSYMARFDRINLCGLKWRQQDAEAAADEILHSDREVIVALGARVAKAFAVEFRPFERIDRIIVLPHPSGRCHLWNDPESYGKAREVMKEFLPCS